MYKGKKILAVIPARGGSKGIEGKNIIDLGGKPLVAWTINEAKKSRYIDRLIISTDDLKIASVAQKYGCEVPFMRPPELAGDFASSESVLFHVLENINQNFDYLLLLQPTSPFRRVEHINGIVEFTIDQNYLQAISVSPTKKHPALMRYVHSGNILVDVVAGKGYLRRQDLPSVYEIDGALYMTDIKEFNKYKTLKSKNARGFVMKNYTNVDIDEQIDLSWAKFLLESGLVVYESNSTS